MKIVHISTYDYGGAGLAALRLHKALLEKGIDSKMLVREKQSNLDTVYVAKESGINKYNPPKSPILRLFKVGLRKIGIGIPKLEKFKKRINLLQIKYPTFYTFPISSYELHKHPLITEAQIIHLHWIEDFLDYNTFFKNVNKPIIWTFHDINPMQGGFHHIRKKETYYPYYKSIEDKLYDIKKTAISCNENINLVAISEQMERLISSHELYKSRPISLIPNSIDGNKFNMLNKEDVRRILGFPIDKRIFLFVNTYLNDTEKGLDLAIEAINSLAINNALLICVGEGTIPPVSIPTIHFHSIKDSIWLSLLYSMSDFLLFPSHQESFAQTPLESICCGTPVLITPVSGAEDLITKDNGIISKDFSVNSFANCISTALSRNYYSEQMRTDVICRFSSNTIVKKYIDLYESKIKGKHTIH